MMSDDDETWIQLTFKMLPYVPQHRAHRRLTAPRLRPRRHDRGTKPATATPKSELSGAAARCRAPRDAGNLEAAQRRASGGGRSFTVASWCCGSAVIRSSSSSSRRSVKAARTVLFFCLLPSCLSVCLTVCLSVCRSTEPLEDEEAAAVADDDDEEEDGRCRGGPNRSGAPQINQTPPTPSRKHWSQSAVDRKWPPKHPVFNNLVIP